MDEEIRATLEWALGVADTLTNAGPAWDAAKMGQRIEEARTWLDALPAAPAPDWSTAPEWAQFHVYNEEGVGIWTAEAILRNDPRGHWWWLSNTPVEDSGLLLPIGIDWRQTLRKRPE